MENNKLIPKNLMEDIVDSRIDELMDMSAICKCRRCRADVWALALNNLPTKYAVSVIGDVHTRYAMMNIQMKTDITSAILKAISIVSQNAHHDES